MAILIVALLAAIAFPLISKQRREARVTVCLSNLKQIGLATHLYAGDNEGKQIPPYIIHFPGNIVRFVGQSPFVIPKQRPAEWKEALSPYIKSDKIFFCPFDHAYSNKIPHNQALNDEVKPGEAEDVRWKYTSYQTWSGLVQRLFSDGNQGIRVDDADSSTTRYIHDPYFIKEKVASNEYPYYSLHGDMKVNTLFLDGHVKTLPLNK